jgi:hypothetical protein
MSSLLTSAGMLATTLAAVAAMSFDASTACAQGYVAAIAFSQSTGKIGYTAREARTEQHAKMLALRSAGAPDAKVWMWAQNEWVAIAVSDDNRGTAGFAHARSADEAQRMALRQCQRLAKGGACTVKLCVHSSGMRPRNLLAIPRDPSLPPLPKKSEFFAAIAYSPSTGKIGYTAANARTKEDAQARAVKNSGAKDAKPFMWGNEWVAIAIAEGRQGVAGFGPGATREVAERYALEQCRKLSKGAPVRIVLAVHSSGERYPPQVAKAPAKPAPSGAPELAGPQLDAAVAPASAQLPAKTSDSPPDEGR